MGNRGRVHRLVLSVLLVGGGVLGAAPAMAAAHTYNVNTTKDLPWKANVCPKAVKGQCSLRAAIAQANMDSAGDTIKVPSGTYRLTVQAAGDRSTPTGSGGFTDLNINAAMSIVGAGSGKTIVNGNGTWNVFTVDSPFGALVSISKLTITGGGESMVRTMGKGGGVLMFANASLTLQDDIVSNNNVTGPGGGIYSSGFLTLNRVRVTGNSSAGDSIGGTGVFQGPGGGIALSGSGDISNSTIDNNDSLRGGGINVFGSGILYLKESTVSGNSARNSGGGVRVTGGFALIKFSTITQNCANAFKGCTSQGNGIDKDAVGAQNGGGVMNLGGGYLEIGGTIVAGNKAFNRSPNTDDCFAPGTDRVTSARNNLLGIWTSACEWEDVAASRYVNEQDFYDLIGVPGDPYDPFIGPLTNNGGATPTHALIDGSDAIDAANGLTSFGGPPADIITPDSWFDCDATDQRGKPRAVDTYYGYPICDEGSYEFP
jgi:hypothetical protein